MRRTNAQDPRIAETLAIGRNIITLYSRGHRPAEADKLLHISESQRCYCLRALKRALGAKTREQLVRIVLDERASRKGPEGKE